MSARPIRRAGAAVPSPAWLPRILTSFSTRKSRRITAASSLVVLAGGLIAWLSWSSAPNRPAVRARQYAAFTQCLLTDSSGIGSAQAASVWTAMQQASATTSAKSQFLAIPPGTTPGDAGTYANTLIARGCDVILAVGPIPVHAAAQTALTNPTRHFLLVGSVPAAANTAVVRPGGTAGAAVAKVLTDAFHGRFTSGTAD